MRQPNYTNKLISLALYLGFLGLLFFPVPAEADEGILNAVSFRPIPPGAAIVVRPWDNSDENMKTARIIKTQLQNLGYTLSPNAKLTLSFETKNALGKW